MADRFSLKDIVSFFGGEVCGDPDFEVCGVAPFESAAFCEIALAKTKSYIAKIPESGAGAFIVPEKPDLAVNCIVHPNPYACFARVMALFYPLESKGKGIDTSAVTGKNFKCGRLTEIGANSVIGDNVEIGDNVSIYPGVVIGDNVIIGSETRIYPNVTVYSGSFIGKRVIIHSSSVIGSDGFGFAPDETGWVKINHQGRVVIGDDVEIGASNTIDRGTFGDTVISSGVKTDNHVHIAHNVNIGEKTILVGQSGIAGSTKIGKNCIIAGKAGISGHLEIGDNVIIGPMSGVTGNIKSGSIVSGYPSVSHSLWLKVLSVLPRLPELRKKIVRLEKKINKLEEE